MAEQAGWSKFCKLYPEDTWGETPVTPTYLQIPYATYDVAVRPERATTQLYFGQYQQRHNRITKATLNGSLSLPLWAHHLASKSIAEWLITWALDRTDPVSLTSFGVEHSEIDHKRHSGLRVDTLTLAGNADAQVIDLTLALQGKGETGGITPNAFSATVPHPNEFMFHDATLEVASAEVEMIGFSLSISNALSVRHTNAFMPTRISAGMRAITFAFDLFKSGNTYDALRRAASNTDSAVVLTLLGNHGGTGASGTQTNITITLPKCRFQDVSEGGDINTLMQQGPSFVPLKPASSSGDIEVAYALV